MININFVIDLSAIEQFQALTQRNIVNAQRSAVRRTVTVSKSALQEKLQAKYNLPMRVFKQHRVKSFLQLVPGTRLEHGQVWLGFNAIKAAYAGRLANFGRGAFAGDYYFEGGFVATMSSGHKGIFKRVGRHRRPIAEQTVTLQDALGVVQSLVPFAAEQHQGFFVAKLQEYDSRLR
jgi:hypothetical protein